MIGIEKINKLVDDLNQLAKKLDSRDHLLLNSTIILINILSMQLIEAKADNRNMKHYLAKERNNTRAATRSSSG